LYYKVYKNKSSQNTVEFFKECKEDKIKHRLTAPYIPQTNVMIKELMGTIKNTTIKVEEYYNIKDLNKF
jgi:transposase InsO family protein